MIDLHLHFDGSLPPDTIYRLAREQGIALPTESKEELTSFLRVPKECRSLTEYLECFRLPLLVLQKPDAVSAAMHDLCGQLKAEGTSYAEIRFAPQLHTNGGACQKEIVDAALDGLRSSGLFGRLILCCMRGTKNEPQNIETLRLAAAYLGRGVAAADLAGAEALFPTEQYRELFAYARRMEIPFTIHAGEAAGPESVRAALSFGAARIGHGVRAAQDPSLIEELSRRQIPLELCYSSNLQTHAVASPEQFPLCVFLEAGVPVTINTDNRTVSATTAAREHELLREKFSLRADETKKLLENAVSAAFLSAQEKKSLLALEHEKNRRISQKSDCFLV